MSNQNSDLPSRLSLGTTTLRTVPMAGGRPGTHTSMIYRAVGIAVQEKAGVFEVHLLNTLDMRSIMHVENVKEVDLHNAYKLLIARFSLFQYEYDALKQAYLPSVAEPLLDVGEEELMQIFRSNPDMEAKCNISWVEYIVDDHRDKVK